MSLLWICENTYHWELLRDWNKSRLENMEKELNAINVLWEKKGNVPDNRSSLGWFPFWHIPFFAIFQFPVMYTDVVTLSQDHWPHCPSVKPPFCGTWCDYWYLSIPAQGLAFGLEVAKHLILFLNFHWFCVDFTSCILIPLISPSPCTHPLPLQTSPQNKTKFGREGKKEGKILLWKL